MKFFHVYNEDCIKGLEKNGLINKDTGFKLQHCFAVPKERLFNNIAQIGGTLHSLIKRDHIPFYVDRIAGGITYYPYQFDKKLIKEYRNLLGDEFLGFQLHESASNRRAYEWSVLRNKIGSNGPYSVEELRRKLKSAYAVTREGEYLTDMTHDSLEYFAGRTYAQTLPAWLDEVREMFLRRMDDTDGNILAVDSYYLFTRMQNELGVRTFMPEVGFQICLMRQAVALARGMAKANGKKWGTYYECWRADRDEQGTFTFNMPCFNSDPINEWYLTQETHPDDFTSHGSNGGSSRLLQERIYYHTLMSGADYFSEEWGLNCSYTNMQTFELSPYGQLKKDFINQALDMQGVQATIPFAIVLPKAYECMIVPDSFQVHTYRVHNEQYMDVPLTKDEIAYYGHIEDVLKLFFAQRNPPTYGNESHVLTNSRFGDVADIIYEDCSDEAFSRYAYLIDASLDSSFTRAKAGKGLNILESRDLDALEQTMDALIPKTMPAYADSLHWLVSTDDKGRRFITVFNNEGNHRTSAQGDVINHQFDHKVKITLNVPGSLKIFKNTREDLHLEKTGKNTWCATIGAADFAVFTF